MENSYGIGVANRYALFLDDESDPLETLTLKEKEKELKKKNKVAEKENKGKSEPPVVKGKTTVAAPKKPVKESKVQDNKRDDNKQTQRSNADGKPDREKNFKYSNENREERNNRRNREDRPFNGPSENREREDRPRRSENFTGGDNFDRNRERGERRGGDGGVGREGREGRRDGGEGREGGRALGQKPGGPRGPRRNFDDRRGKREFDRQSGSDKTGVKPVDKRDGAGAHNWGSHKDVIEEADRPNDAEQNWGDEIKAETTEEKKEEVEAETIPVEEEPKELTLDEWKAQRAGRVKPTFNIRKAGEGEDPTQWKKMFELRKKEKDENSGVQESEEEEYDAAEYPQRAGRQRHVLDIDIQFNDNRRPGGGGGGRGRGQRSGPRGGNRGGNRGAGGGGREGREGGGGGRDGGRDGRDGGGRDGGREGGDRNDRRFRGAEEQVLGNYSTSLGADFAKNEDRISEKQAPKVDDERDFPSLG